MGNATADTLYRIAARKAADNRGWDALAAHMAADALLITGQMEQHPNALLDIGPLRALDVPGTSLPGVAGAYRKQLLTGLDSWGLAGTMEAVLPEITLTDTPLDLDAAGEFSAAWLGGRDLRAFSSAERARSVRLAALAGRLYAAGEYPAAARSAEAADRSTVAAHYGAEAAQTGDVRLAALRTAMLLAEDALAAAAAATDIAATGRLVRQAHEAANLTDKPIHWETISYLC